MAATTGNKEDDVAIIAPMNHLRDNIAALRDFVATVEMSLKEERENVFKTRGKHLLPLLLAVKELSPEATPTLKHVDQASIEKITGLKVKIKTRETEPNKKIAELTIIGGNAKAMDDAVSQLGKNQISSRLLYETTLISLLNSVELFFSQLFHFYYQRFPEAVGAKEKAFSMEDLELFDSITDAKNHLRETRVENLLRDSFEEWILFLKKQAGLSMGYLNDHWNDLVETWQRRNLIVHNGGVVNSIYLTKVKDSHKQKTNGDRLHVSSKYLQSSFDSFEKNCLLIALELWKKIAPKDERRGGWCVDEVYKLVLAGNWPVAESLSYFLTEDRSMSESHQLVAKMNYWLCLKRQKRWEEISKNVESENMDAKAATFRLAWFALTERFDDFFEALPKALKAGEIADKDLLEWPILLEARADSRFQSFLRRINLKKKKVRKAKPKPAKEPPD